MRNARPFVQWRDAALERKVLDSISLDVPWSVVEQFSTLVRLSGSEEERQAVDILIGHLQAAGVAYSLYDPECFISIPLSATVRADEPDGKSYRAKTVSMSVSTGGQEISGAPPSLRSSRFTEVMTANLSPICSTALATRWGS